MARTKRKKKVDPFNRAIGRAFMSLLLVDKSEAKRLKAKSRGQ